MKLLCTILALLILILSAQPACIATSINNNSCCSEAGCNGEVEQNDTDSKNDQDQGCTKGCNPFQVCGCCAFSIVVPTPVPLLVSHSITAPIDWGILSVEISEEPSSSCWQPPKAA